MRISVAKWFVVGFCMSVCLLAASAHAKEKDKLAPAINPFRPLGVVRSEASQSEVLIRLGNDVTINVPNAEGARIIVQPVNVDVLCPETGSINITGLQIGESVVEVVRAEYVGPNFDSRHELAPIRIRVQVVRQ